MAVDQIDIVDLIGIDNNSGDVVLTISDHLEWSTEHLLTLQEKLNTYLSFIESGELYNSYPLAHSKRVSISVICKYQADELALQFFEKAKTLLEAAGFGLSYMYLESD